MRTFSAAIAATSLLFAMGCDAGTGADGGGTDPIADGGADAGSSDDTTASGDATGGGDTTATGGDVAAVDAGPAAATYSSVVIYDGSKTTPATCKGTGPGADLDFVAVYRNKLLIGVAKKGTTDYKAGSDAECKKNEHNDAAAIDGVTGGFGDICAKGGKKVDDCKNSDLSQGYLSLGGGSVELQFGACQKADAAKPDNDQCDGSGDLLVLQAGDEIDVHEIGEEYKSKYGMKCVCANEGYEVDVRVTKGADAGSKFLSGAPGGSKTFTIPADK
jgi:hypothetical protein